jgi:hypothetical protein
MMSELARVIADVLLSTSSWVAYQMETQSGYHSLQSDMAKAPSIFGKCQFSAGPPKVSKVDTLDKMEGLPLQVGLGQSM